jgi:hypothetical protein
MCLLALIASLQQHRQERREEEQQPPWREKEQQHACRVFDEMPKRKERR